MIRNCLLTIMCITLLSPSFFHLRNIARLRSMLSLSVTERLINTFVFSRIDYCNALLVGVPITTLNFLALIGARKN